MTNSAKEKILRAREAKNAPLNHVSLEMQTSTHFPLLIKAVQMTKGTVAELGSGLFSTPLLHWLCFGQDRKLITYESYRHYLTFAEKFKTESHDVRFVRDWEKESFDESYSVVFIDHSINGKKHTRGDDAIRFADKAEYVILHDAGANSLPKYGYEETYKHFKYRYDWTGCYPHTTILSNVHDLHEFSL